MGPKDGTPEWKDQVRQIVTLGDNLEPTSQEELDQLTLLYTFDESYSRSAILQATHELKMKFKL